MVGGVVLAAVADTGGGGAVRSVAAEDERLPADAADFIHCSRRRVANSVRKIRANTAKPVVLTPVYPNAGVARWYNDQLDTLINQTTGQLLHAVAAAWAKTPPIFHNSHITAGYGLDAKPSVPAWKEATAAGVMFVCKYDAGPRLLLLYRADGLGWSLPAGTREYGEHPEQTARRESYEETGYTWNGDLNLVRVQEWHDVRCATYIAEVPEPFVPVLNAEHKNHVWLPLKDCLDIRLHPGLRATLELWIETGYALGIDSDVALDAPSPTKAIQAALAKWGSQTIKRFDLMSEKIADDFAARNMQATQAAVLSQFKRAGFTVKFKPTRASIEAYRAVAAENVALIRSIPRKYHEAVEQKVWNAVRGGSDLNKLSAELRKAHKITVDRAALIARDQNAKAKAVIERVRQQELGISRGIWQHSAAGKEPRPTHVAMDGKPYSLARGMWDSDEGEYVHPGQLINCRCTMRPVIEGFEE